MSAHSFRSAFVTSIALVLVACGGEVESPGSAKFLPTEYSSEGRPINSCSLSPECSGVPTAPYFANVSSAPADSAALSGIVRLEVQGNEMRNVELLPASGYTPRLGVFNVTGDGTFAWLDLDTRALPNGVSNLRISAFNVPPGQGGTEIVAMPARAWNISNPTPPSGSFTAAVSTAPANNTIVKGIVHLEVHGNRIANAELLPSTGYLPQFGVFNVSADRTTATLDFDTRSLPDGIHAVRISAFNVMPGQPNAVEAVAMPARQWDFRNGSTSAFTASATITPLHGEIVNGVVRFEVRGTGIENAELLPPNSYTPRLGVFSVSADKTFAWLALDTQSLANGPFSARVSVFNVAAGQPNAKEIIAMPSKQLIVRH